jgi:hypothetical protein
MPGHLEQRLSIVIPRRIEHSRSAGNLSIANKVDDVLRRRVDVGKDLIPSPDTGTNKLLESRVLNGLMRFGNRLSDRNPSWRRSSLSECCQLDQDG